MLSVLHSRPARGAPDHAASRTPPVLTRAEACPRGHGRMDLHDANWERFCRYYVGDWYGRWTPFTADGVALALRQCIRSFQRTADERAIIPQQHDPSAAVPLCGWPAGAHTLWPLHARHHARRVCRGEFFLGVARRGRRDPVRLRDRVPGRRVSCQHRGPQRRPWGGQPLVVMTEHLGRFAERSPAVEIPALPLGCRGFRWAVTPGLRGSPAAPVAV